MHELLAASAPALRLLHALLGVLFVSALIGRWIVLAQAERAARRDQIASVETLVSASAVFERTVIFSSQVVLVLGLCSAWAMGYPLLGFLQGGAVNWVLVALVLYLSVAFLIPTIFIPRGKIFAAALADSVATGKATRALVAAFGDPVTRAAHVYELGSVAVVLVLMIAKPF